MVTQGCCLPHLFYVLLGYILTLEDLGTVIKQYASEGVTVVGTPPDRVPAKPVLRVTHQRPVGYDVLVIT